MKLIKQNVLGDSKNYSDAWKNAGIEARRSINQHCFQENLNPATVKVNYQSAGEGKDYKTARALMDVLCQKAYSRKLDRDSFMTPVPAYPIQSIL